jgi:N-acetylglucosamine-6-sulfatase
MRKAIRFSVNSIFYLSGCLILLAACKPSSPGSSATLPNVVFIMADDQRQDMLSCQGNPYVRTPHLDRLAAEGCRFENAFTVSGVCSPSRANFFSGKYSHNCAAPQIIWKNNSFLLNEIPFPALLHKEGYYSSHIGKWHLGEGQKPKAGYDHWAGFEWLGAFYNTTVHIDGQIKQFEGFSDDILAGLAAEKIRELAGTTQPFCLFVGLKAPHLPFSYPERYETYLDSVDVTQPENIDENYDESGRAPIMKTNVIRVRTFQGGIPGFGSWEHYVKSYYRSSQALDDAVGIILDALDKSGITEETIVVYSSDQGYTLGEHGMTEKHYAYEQVMRIPMIIRYPALIPPGITPDEMVLNIDVAPTLLDLCGMDPPEDMDGSSWRPILQAGDRKVSGWREDFLFEYWDYRPTLPSQLAVRSEQYKLITYQDHPERELYDLAADPAENHNRIDDPAYQDVLSEMEGRLDRLIRETGWRQRRFQPVNNCYVIGPVAEAETEAVRAVVFGEEFDPDQSFAVAGQDLTWEKIAFGSDGSLDFGSSVPEMPGHSMLVSIPVRRLSERDPHAILDMVPARETQAFHRGELIWETQARQALGLSWYNFPLMESTYVIRLQMPCEGPGRIKMRINAPEGSVSLL